MISEVVEPESIGYLQTVNEIFHLSSVYPLFRLFLLITRQESCNENKFGYSTNKLSHIPHLQLIRNDV